MPVQKTPLKPLPASRIAFSKQVEILRAFGILSGPEPRPVTNAEVGKVVQLKPDTVSMGNGFFAAIALLTKAEGGYIPSPQLLAYARAYKWTQEQAFFKLAPVIQETWFAAELLPLLRFRSISVEEAIGALGQVAGVGPESRSQLESLIGFLDESGLVIRENGNLQIGHTVDELPKDQPPPSPPISETLSPPPSPKPRRSDAGGIDLTIDINVDLADMGKWSPERITAFMTGLAEVLKAKSGLESTET